MIQKFEIINLLDKSQKRDRRTKEWDLCMKKWEKRTGSCKWIQDEVEVLSGEILDKFVADLQDEIINVIGDFGKNIIGENAKLVLYSGIDYEFVQEFCEASNGEYYMISRDCKKLDLFTHHKNDLLHLI